MHIIYAITYLRGWFHRKTRSFYCIYCSFPHRILKLYQVSLTWSCVSLTRSTASSENYYNMANMMPSFQMLLFWDTFHFKKKLLTLQPRYYSIWVFTHLKLCLADAIHNFKWVKIIQIWQNGGQLFSNIADWCHILSLTCLKGGT